MAQKKKSTKSSKSRSKSDSSQARSALIWRVVTFVIVGVMSVIILQKFIHAVKISNDSKVIVREINGYKESIERDSALLEQLKYDDMLEEYTHEHYLMQRKGEVVYIVK